jgi:hypothetical protein
LTAGSLHKCLTAVAGTCALASALAASAAGNPIARGTPFTSGTVIDGRWNGADIERRTNCNAAQNNGTRGTYAEFVVSTNTAVPTPVIGITQNGVTGLICNYYGDYHVIGANRSAEGTYNCTDGKTGTFRTRSILASEEALSIHMDIVLSGTESCTIDAIIGAARLP